MTSISELDGLAVIWLQIFGTMSPIFGWSGIVARNRSNFSLKSSIEIFSRSLSVLGRLLNSWGPAIWKLWCLRFCTAGVPLVRGIRHSLPLLSLDFDWIPQLGTFPSSTFQVYSILYRSALLCWENIFQVFEPCPIVKLGYFWNFLGKCFLKIFNRL